MVSQHAVLAPATPSEFLTSIIARHRYPTTIIIASDKQAFLDSLIYELESEESNREPNSPNSPLLQGTLFQTAVSRHIRIIFTPTVTHLRAYLTVFSRDDSTVPAPPNFAPGASKPAILVYGLVELHRETSECSAQGLSNSASALVEAAARNQFRALVVEPRRNPDVGSGEPGAWLEEKFALLSEKNSGSWSDKTVELRRVLGRWFKIDLQTQEISTC